MFFKKLLSYLFPIKQFEKSSSINKNIEVTWNFGALVLNSKNTNFSYGSLESVMRIGIKNIGKETISKYQTALILGVAGGSVIKLLQNEFEFTGKITGIELDKEIIEIANKYFNLHKIKNFELINEDASIYVRNIKRQFDFIVVDIFQDNIMPDFLFTEQFVSDLKRIVAIKGTILFNSIATLSNEFERNLAFEKLLKQNFQNVTKLSKVEGNNELFIICD